MKKISTFALIATLFSTATFAASPESKDTAKDTVNAVSYTHLFLAAGCVYVYSTPHWQEPTISV